MLNLQVEMHRIFWIRPILFIMKAMCKTDI